MPAECIEAERQITRLLQSARRKLDLSVAFLSRIDETSRTMEVVDSIVPGIAAGDSGPRDAGFCLAVVEGRLPRIMPDVRLVPEAVRRHPASLPQIRSHVSVPVVLSDGAVYGTFCVFGLTTEPEVDPTQLGLVEVLAEAAAMVIEPLARAEQCRAEVHGRLAPLMAAGGPTIVVQPIVELAGGTRVGAEALSRFPSEWCRTPDLVFAEAHSVGVGDRLELLAMVRAAALLEQVSGYVSINVSPSTLLAPECAELLDTLPLERVVLELSEHDPVHDYGALSTALVPRRARGMRLAIDDVGAGFSSLRHIVLAAPEIIKLDRSLVSGVDRDPVLAKLTQSMVEFAHSFGAGVVAEGVETAAEYVLLRSLGVDGGQGWLFGRPGPACALADAGIGAALTG